MKVALCLLAVLLLSGCRISRYSLDESLSGQSIEVKSGDRLSIELDEHPKGGYVWLTECDDPDISFARETIEADDDAPAGTPDKVRIIIRVARGFDGPAHVKIVSRQNWKGGKTARQLDFILYHLQEDKAPWRNVY